MLALDLSENSWERTADHPCQHGDLCRVGDPTLIYDTSDLAKCTLKDGEAARAPDSSSGHSTFGNQDLQLSMD